MVSQYQHRAPITLELVLNIKSALTSRGLSREEFIKVLNEFLPETRRIKSNHSGVVQLNRWLNPTGERWVEPRAEIAFAMQKALEKIEKK